MKLLDMLLRNAAAVDEDRAKRIERSVKKTYQRKIQDIKEKRSDLIDKIEASTDIKGEETTSMVNPKNFDAVKFVDTDMEDSLNLIQYNADLAVLETRYEELFGEKVKDI